MDAEDVRGAGVKPVFYNEFDPKAAAWLRELIAAGEIPAGDVDERSIADVQANDLVRYGACHFFAGIGGWALALRLSGVPDGEPIWTGSCPCQPFSCAGKQRGTADERHLWPEFFRLIRECRPRIVFGEQVASSAVVGKAGQHPYLQEVRDREALLGVLRQLQGQPGQLLHGVCPRRRAAEEAQSSGADGRAIQGVEEAQSWVGAGQCREVPRQEPGDGVRLGPGGHSEKDRRGEVRTVGDSIWAFGAAGLERPFVGPDRPGAWLHEGECAGCPVRGECDGEYLGAEPDFGDCVGDFYPPPGCVERAIGTDRASVDEEVVTAWLDGIRNDLEAANYTCGAAILGAHSVGAPHIRQRLYWVADAAGDRAIGNQRSEEGARGARWAESVGCGATRGLADRPSGGQRIDGGASRDAGHADQRGEAGGVGDVQQQGLERLAGYGDGRCEPGRDDADAIGSVAEAGAACGAWSDFDILPCRDGKARRVESGAFPLVAGLPAGVVPGGDPSISEVQATGEARVMRLRGYGNAIVPQVAAEFIRAFLDTRRIT